MNGWPDGIVPSASEQCIGRINKRATFCNGRRWEMFIAEVAGVGAICISDRIEYCAMAAM
ncbi:hypothetical protein [Pseudomonas amygdali]|uniref:hypothetical protein n=1 Tax=Pseudomonas amygdali TaxID=47877 RepID=UPI001054E893|nr:hypothetical protein [Pseudomonas amygdali]